MSVTIALCDDEEDQITYLRRLIGEWASDKPFAVNIAGYESAEQFLFEYADRPCDLLLLDIEMNGINGIELAKKLRAEGDKLPVLFITGYSEFMSEGYDVEALHYLLKPVEKEKLFSVLDRYVRRREIRDEILISAAEKKVHVAVGNIVFIEAFGRNTEVHLADKTVLDCKDSIGGFENIRGFIRSHRSYLVNLKFVRSISRTAVTLDGGEEIPLSRRLYKDVNRQFIEYYTGGDKVRKGDGIRT